MQSYLGVYTRPEDGGVAIVIGAPGISKELVLERSIPETAIKVREIVAADLPQDRYFRNAWTDEFPGPQIDINMEKARVIQMENIKLSRDLELKRLDTEQLKVITDPIAVQAIEDEKQVLRDIPQTFDLTIASTPEELKALWPTEVSRKV